MITRKQATALMVNAIVVKMLITFPATLTESCGNSAWLAGLYTTAVAVGIFACIRKVYICKCDAIGIAEKLGGKWLRVVVGGAIFFVLGANIIGLIRIFPDVIRLVLLQKTYIEVIGTVFVISIIFGAACGIESVARVTELFLPVATVVFVAFIIMIIPKAKIDNLFPLLGNGLYAIATKGLSNMSIFADILVLNLLIPHIEDLDGYKRSGTRAIIIGGVASTVILLIYGLCYVYPVSAQFIIPIYQLERMINLGAFFSRLEALFQFIWSISILLYITLYIAVMAETWKKTFNLTHSKPLIAPVLIGIVGVGLIPASIEKIIVWEKVTDMYIYIPALLIPLVLGAFYKMFHVKQKEERNENN